MIFYIIFSDCVSLFVLYTFYIIYNTYINAYNITYIYKYIFLKKSDFIYIYVYRSI